MSHVWSSYDWFTLGNPLPFGIIPGSFCNSPHDVSGSKSEFGTKLSATEIPFVNLVFEARDVLDKIPTESTCDDELRR